ncbi:MAG TPA: flagellar hook-basal body complex protein FliE [Steroidobacteraceae bacterium]|nr:flagellar hook-basal body complex protein FliE [Steroidobacteraceae bacterium]
MSQLQIDQVLSQIRTLAAQTQSAGIRPASLAAGAQAASGTAAVSGAGSTFATLMRSGIEQANQTELRANDLADKFERGAPGVDLPTVMLEANKANLTFRAVTEVRNRLITAYTDIMNMQL